MEVVISKILGSDVHATSRSDADPGGGFEGSPLKTILKI